MQEKVLEELRRVLKIPAIEPVPPDARLFDEMGLTSIHLITLLTRLCEDSGIDMMALQDTDLRSMQTPRDIASVLSRVGA